MEQIWSILIILLIGGAVAAAIILPMRLGVKHRVLWRIGFAVLCILLVIVGVFVENQIWEAKRFNTVEEMAESCIPDVQLKDVIYYEDYAVLFCRNEIEKSEPIYTTQRDENGWKAYRRENGKRWIGRFIEWPQMVNGQEILNETDISTLTLSNDGLDFIWIRATLDLPTLINPEAFKHEVKDSEGTEFPRVIIKGLDMPIYYTFADADAPGYEVSIDGESISISQTCKKYGNIIYNYREEEAGEYSGPPIIVPLIIGLVFLTGAILMGVFAYKRGSKGLIVGCVICGVPAFLFLVMAIGNWLA